MPGFFETSVEFIKGIGTQKAAILNKELAIFNYADLLQHYPFRYEDRTKFYQINELSERLSHIQIKGKIRHIETLGAARKRRLVVHFKDETGEIELVWFKGIDWVLKQLHPGSEYIVFGKPNRFGKKLNIAHPEIEIATHKNENRGYLHPVYHSTERLKAKFFDSKAFSNALRIILEKSLPHIRETLPTKILEDYGLIAKKDALITIHFPIGTDALAKARYRLKYEEFFYLQLRLVKLRLTRIEKFRGQLFNESTLVNDFYKNHIPFELTNAQKRVIKEAYRDFRSGRQMNRLLQGDVGSGKTMVAFICMLIAITNGAQATIMAPTEILANQHYEGLKEYADKMGLKIAKLTGSTKTRERKQLHEALRAGVINILVGTHALLEDIVQYQNLGLAIIDEQHRFGVAQRARLWNKNKETYPHVMVMTATPIPRTLAMSLYGDLDISVIDELPAGRKPIETRHAYDSNRLKVFGFMKKQIALGRQIYIVYPLIEESEKLDLKNLEDGYESIIRAFPEVPVSLVHGRMKADAKDYEMQRFVKGETKIMVATTVIEVGVNVPNASVMIIENAERFGLAQLHQLRGRVGRGAEQSFCILMTSFKISKEGRTRIDTMVRTNNGFEIADVDLKLRGPGDITGTQQSGILDLTIADLGKDGRILQIAREAAIELLEKDPGLSSPENAVIQQQIASQKKSNVNWGRIS